MTKNVSRRDWQILSDYLDEQLSARERARFEMRLNENPELRLALDEMRSIQSLLLEIPAKRAPRNFTLTPQMVGIKKSPPQSFIALRFASAISAILLMVVWMGNLFLPMEIDTLLPMVAGSEKPEAAFEAHDPQLYPPKEFTGEEIGEEETTELPPSILREPEEEAVEPIDQEPQLDVMALPEPDATQTAEANGVPERVAKSLTSAPAEIESPDPAPGDLDYEVDEEGEIGALALRDNMLNRISRWGIQDFVMAGLALIAVSTGLGAIYIRRKEGRWS
jgi:hypothetical protein